MTDGVCLLLDLLLLLVPAACAAALVLLLSIPAIAADKSFRRDDLTDAAIKLEAQIKGEAGQVTKPAAALRREADAAFQRNDFRTGLQILGQIVTVAPEMLEPLTFSSAGRGARHLLLLLYRCTAWQGEPRALDAADIRWVLPDALADYDMPPADRPFVSVLAAERGG